MGDILHANAIIQRKKWCCLLMGMEEYEIRLLLSLFIDRIDISL